MDPLSVADAVTMLKSGFDGVRSALSVFREARDLLPKENQADAERAVEHAERQLAVSEAQIAKALGFTLCTCAFPPTPMLKVGYVQELTRVKGASAFIRRNAHRCPKCGQDDAFGQRITEPQRD